MRVQTTSSPPDGWKHIVTEPDLTPGSDAWLKLVTASKVPAIVGTSPWDSPYSIWMKMAGRLPREKTTEAMVRGTLLEPAILAWWKAKHPEYHTLREQVIYRKGKWLLITPDGIATDWQDESVVVEAKSASRLDHWGDPGTDQIPPYYRPQVQMQLHVTGLKKAFVPVIGPYLEFREYVVTADEAYGQELEEYCEWFHGTIQAGVEPPLDKHPATYDAVRRIHEGIEDGVAVELDTGLAVEYIASLSGFTEAEHRMKAAKAEVLDLMKKAEFAMCNGEVVAKRKRNRYNVHLEQVCKDVSVFDREQLGANSPDQPFATQTFDTTTEAV